MKPASLRVSAEVIAVVDRDRSGILEGDDRFAVHTHRRHGASHVLIGIRSAHFRCGVHAQAGRHITVQRIVRRGLIRHDIRDDTTTYQLGKHLGTVPDQPDGDRVTA